MGKQSCLEISLLVQSENKSFGPSIKDELDRDDVFGLRQRRRFWFKTKATVFV